VECPYCGSRNIIWDYERGEIVCGECGTVFDKIYSFIEYRDEEPIYISRVNYNSFYRKIGRINEWRERVVGRDIVLYNGAFINKESFDAAKIIESNEKYLIIYDIMNRIPKFKAKDIRYKIAIALYLVDKKEFDKFRLLFNIREKYLLKILNSMNRKDKEKLSDTLKNRLNEFMGGNISFQHVNNEG